MTDTTTTETIEPGAELAKREPTYLATPTTPSAEWAVIMQQAEVLCKSDIVPQAYRGRSANVVAAALSGRVFGWDVMAAMRNGNVIEGSYAIKPEAQLGLVRAAGHSVSGKVADLVATVTGKRADNGDEMTVVWSLDRAVRAGLVSLKDGKPYARSRSGNHPLPWEAYTESMLWARAVSELCRQLFSDVTLGLSYTADEVMGGAFIEVDGEVRAAEASAPLPAGWESWDECDAAHDTYVELWHSAPQAARTAVTAWRNEHAGYERPMAKAKLNALAAKLNQEIERAPAEAPATDVGGDGPGAGGTILTGHSESDETRTGDAGEDPLVTIPSAANSDGIEDADVVGEGDAEVPADTTTAPAEAPSPTETAGDEVAPAAGLEPVEPGPVADASSALLASAAGPPLGELASAGEKARFATLMAEVFLPAERELARHAMVAIVSNGRTRTSTELTGKEIAWAIKGAKLFGQGKLVFGVLDDQDQQVPLEQFSVPTDEQVPLLFSAAPEGGSTVDGDEYVTKLGAFLRGE